MCPFGVRSVYNLTQRIFLAAGLGSVYGLSPPIRVSKLIVRRIYLPNPSTHLNPDNQNRADLSLLRPPLVQTTIGRYGNIKPVFHRLRLSASTKDPTNPEQSYFTQEPLGFRRHGISPCLSLLMPAYSFPSPPPGLPSRASTVNGTLAYLPTQKC